MINPAILNVKYVSITMLSVYMNHLHLISNRENWESFSPLLIFQLSPWMRERDWLIQVAGGDLGQGDKKLQARSHSGGPNLDSSSQNMPARESEKVHGKQVLTTKKSLLLLTFSYSHENVTLNFSVVMGNRIGRIMKILNDSKVSIWL